MGTSTGFGGGKNSNPLIPSWIGGGEAGAEPDAGDPGAGDPGSNGEEDRRSADRPDGTDQPQAQPPKRYTGPRGSFTKYTKSAGSDRRALGRAVSSFVTRTSGGTSSTARRMSSERSAAASLAGVLSRASTAPGGIREIVQTLNFGSLATRPIGDIYAALVDVICPPDGDLDDAHAREAYLEAVNEVMRNQPPDLERPSPETIKDIIGKFIANAVHQRIVTAIGAGLVTLPTNLAEIRAVENGLKAFLRNCANETMEEFSGDFPETDLGPEIDSIFERAVEIINVNAEETMEDNE